MPAPSGARRFCIFFTKHFFGSRLANSGKLAAAINANIVAGSIKDCVAFIFLERFCKGVLCFVQIGARRFGMNEGKVWNAYSSFGLRFLRLRMVQANIESDFPHAVRVLLPDSDKLAERIRLFRITRFPVFRWPCRITELTTPRDRREDRSPGYDRILFCFPPEFFAVDRIGREDYRIVARTDMDASRNPFSPASLA